MATVAAKVVLIFHGGLSKRAIARWKCVCVCATEAFPEVGQEAMLDVSP